jgi:glucose-6-phosphate 1-dehydrogenase
MPARAAGKPPAAPPCIIVIFGAAGDLTKRLLIPALYGLAKAGLLDDGFKVLGVDHNECDDERFRQELGGFLHQIAQAKGSEFGQASIDQRAWDFLRRRLFYQQADFEDDEAYRRTGQRLQQLGQGAGVLFYLAAAPRFFGVIVERLARAGLARERRGDFRRVVIEKPFGTDLASARALNRRLLKRLDERQIWRIDHFLGKETVRNIMVTRFATGVFEPLWSRAHIDHVQITCAETVGVERRGGYYDHAGALRDMVPNHLFQVLAMTAMEQPASLDADDVRAAKTRLFRAVEVQTPRQALENSVRGQYRAGEVGGRRVNDYRREPDVARTSRTETYVALKLAIRSRRWTGVPFYLRTGKALCARDTEVALRFKRPHSLLDGRAQTPPDTLVLQIQPDDGISLQFLAKRPGPELEVQPVQMDFSYADVFGRSSATGYETLIYDCLTGDRTLFKAADDIELAWRAVQPFLDAWAEGGTLHGYAAGSAGPKAADALLARDGRAWRPIGS